MKFIISALGAVLFIAASTNALGVDGLNRRKATDISESAGLFITAEGTCGYFGTAPFCDPSCPNGWFVHGISNCGDGACCWTGVKYYCCNYPPSAEEQADVDAARAAGWPVGGGQGRTAGGPFTITGPGPVITSGGPATITGPGSVSSVGPATITGPGPVITSGPATIAGSSPATPTTAGTSATTA